MFISFHIHTRIKMASIMSNTLFILFILYGMKNSIHSYRIMKPTDTQDRSIKDDDITSDNEINLRSVLWPRICFTALIKKNEHQYLHNRNQQNKPIKHISTRNARKCYPFDA